MRGALKNGLLLAMMLAASGLAVALRATDRIAEHGERVELERMIPRQFGDWSVDEAVLYQQVSPETTAALNKIYTQVLTRTYVDRQGYRIMLSLPYGANQSDGLAAHDPEGCYPAQGFQILGKSKAVLHPAGAALPIRRMEALAGSRHELVSYWFTVGAYAINNDWDRKKAQLSYAVKGQIADGLLVRVSSIDADTALAYRQQDRFIADLLAALPPAARARVAGAAGVAP
ncbi:exosortase-associated protein EpsI, B-type [Rugamonas sp. DEMB1]|uniref:exosortase-associated protein EpsI, B-type n=1 Tax=Rugamonas sp. DEMB1 TaxID=3039386 RepID=UPI00244D6EF1|nr:exosortase-associated protein EpsI, B-type [Rugamonas sp. DEMB1]WGG49143.1 EpsI family protein [Rugamonas sp. DEMB1]